MAGWIWAGVLQLIILVIIVVGPYIGLYGRDDQEFRERNAKSVTRRR